RTFVRLQRFNFFFQAEDGIRAFHVTGVQTCALPILVEDARLAREAGADGIVVGALQPDGSLDVETLRRVMEAAQLPVTFHRAFEIGRASCRGRAKILSVVVCSILITRTDRTDQLCNV